MPRESAAGAPGPASIPVRASLRLLAWPAALVAASLVPFASGLSSTHVFFVRDLGLHFWPRHLWHRQSWLSGNWPLWDPHPGGGQAAAADALNQFFLLPVTLLRLLPPPVVGFNLWVAAPFPLLAIGSWLWLRRHVAAPAAAVGAGIATFAGPVLSTADTPNLSWAIAAVPWVLLCADRLRARTDAASFSAAALCVAFQALAGEPVTFGVTSVLVMAYAAAVHDRGTLRGTRVGTAARMGAALVTGVLLAAVQLVPLWWAASRSARGLAIDATFWSLHPLSLLETIVPFVFGDVHRANLETLPWTRALNSGREPLFHSLYIGIAAMALCLIRGAAGPGAAWRRFWAAVLFVSLAFAFGEHTPLHSVAASLVPGLGSLRYPIKYLVFAVFAGGALAASGIDVLVAHARGGRSMKRPTAALVATAGFGLASAVLAIGSLGRFSWLHGFWRGVAGAAGIGDPSGAAGWLVGAGPLWLRVTFLCAITAFMIALAWQRHPRAALAAAALGVLAAGDPLSNAAGMHPTIAAARLGPPEWVAATREHPSDRVYVGGRVGQAAGRQQIPAPMIDSPSRFPPPVEWTVPEAMTIFATRFAPTPAPWGVRELISFDLPRLWPRAYGDMIARFRSAGPADRLRFLRRTGHRYCFVPQPPSPDSRLVAASTVVRPMALYECGAAPRRFYVTRESRVEPDAGRHLDFLFGDGPDPEVLTTLEGAPPAPEGVPGAPVDVARIEVLRERNVELILSAAIPAGGGYLNVLDSYDPSWIVQVDGRPATLLRANALFRAVRLAPGTHEVRFAYRPVPLYVGLAVSLAVAMVLGAGAWRHNTKTRRRECA